jgi:hypothetical protein
MVLASVYQPLDQQKQEIRLLRISPSTEIQSPIHCSISLVSLKDDPPPSYQALLYMWGDPELTAEINIEGTGGPTTIGPNLSVTLQCMRHASDDIMLWVDALCINQNDNHERGTPGPHDVFDLQQRRRSHCLAWRGGR